MRVLLVTGRKAADRTRAVARGLSEAFGWDAEVEVLPVELGAFVTPGDLPEVSRYDLVLVPGLARGDYGERGNVYKGTRGVADLSRLSREDFGELSPRLPADRLLNRRVEGEVFEEGEPELVVGGLPVGRELRTRVLAEIVDATDLGEEELLRRARYFVESGADMVDVGVPRDATPDAAADAVELLSRELEVPVSVDTMEPAQVAAALPHADLVLSADGAVLDGVGEELAEAGVPVVVVPGEKGLESNLERADAMGLEVLADPVLDPPLLGMAESLRRYGAVEGRPLFFGAGNVTELLDADSVGVNALLAAAAQEVGASVVFTPEHSVKARGSVRELAVATRMMHLAAREDRSPKDLGLDLLVLKDKVDRDEPVEVVGDVVEAERRGYDRDPKGYFRVGLDRERGRVVAAFHPSEGEPVTIEGKKASEVLSEVVARDLVSLKSHAGYLGRELAKAEAALVTGKSYRQDAPLFERWEWGERR